MYYVDVNNYDHCPTEGALGLLSVLVKTGRSVEAQLDTALASAGLTFAKWRTLETLAKAKAPVTLGMLAEHLSCVKSNITQLIDNLESEGLVLRAAANDDRRSIVVELTNAGTTLHASGRKALESATRSLLKSSSEEERGTLRRLLGLLSRT